LRVKLLGLGLLELELLGLSDVKVIGDRLGLLVLWVVLLLLGIILLGPRTTRDRVIRDMVIGDTVVRDRTI
jgi:hypothetical protein